MPRTCGTGRETSSQAISAGQPVVYVSWFAARAYLKSEGNVLPTVDQWEYVAAASETRRDASRDPAFLERLRVWYGQPTPSRLPAVGSTDRNAYGLGDVHGLIWEWTLDFNSALVTGESRQDSALALALLRQRRRRRVGFRRLRGVHALRVSKQPRGQVLGRKPGFSRREANGGGHTMTRRWSAMMTSWIAAAGLVCGSAACARSEPANSEQGSEPAAAGLADTGPSGGESIYALDLALVDDAGGSLRLADLRGQTIVAHDA
jgi:hypothetical protein